ncbi:MAG: putative manganese transporter [Coriobacteriales bacterium]|jgi:hypothetical protein
MTEVIFESLTDAALDTLKLVPLLFVIYVLIEVLEVKLGNRMGRIMERAGKAGPVLGALLGVIPQCGFSVVGSALYSQRLVTIGTLFAIFIATSDEAIPILLSDPAAAGALLPLILTKLVCAIVVGYALDLVFHRRNRAVFEHEEALEQGHDEPGHHHETALAEKGCCGHEPAGHDGHERLTARTVLLHPLVHTLKIALFILVVSFAIALAFALVGQDVIAGWLSDKEALQPVIAALVGLIPNCAASVAITQFYVDGVITFGAAIAGLSASGGLGLLVLLQEDHRHREVVAIVVGLFAISVVIGLVVQALGVVG